MTKDNNFLAYLYLFLTVTFWAGNFVVGKLASFYEVPPFSLNFYRWLFAWLILAPFTIPEILEKRNYIIKNYKLFIVLGVTSITVFNSIVYYSLNFTQVISGVLMISTIPVMIMLFSSILKIEKTKSLTSEIKDCKLKLDKILEEKSHREKDIESFGDVSKDRTKYQELKEDLKQVENDAYKTQAKIKELESKVLSLEKDLEKMFLCEVRKVVLNPFTTLNIL